MVSLVLLVFVRTDRLACGLTHSHTHTHTQDNYCNPRCTCVPKVNYWGGEPQPKARAELHPPENQHTVGRAVNLLVIHDTGDA